MSLRLKILCLFLPLAVLCVAAQAWFSDRGVRQGFGALETELGEQQIVRVREAFAAETRTLARLTRIDAVWDDPYQLLEGGDPAGASELYPPQDLWRNYDISETVLVGADGRFFAGGRTEDTEAYDPSSSRAAAVASFFVGDATQTSCGLWRADGGAAVSMYCTQPVLRSDGSGPAMGWLTFIQPVDDALIGRLSDQLQLPLALSAGPAQTSSEVRATSESTLQLSIALEVANSDQPLVVTATTERPMTQRAAQTQRALLFAVLGCVGLFATAALLMVEYLVLRRVRTLTGLAAEVGRTGDLTLRPGASPSAGGRGDELVALSDSLAVMLDALHRQRQEVTEQHADAVARLAEASASASEASASRLAAEGALLEARQVIVDASSEVLEQLDTVAASAGQLLTRAGEISDAAVTTSSLTSEALGAVGRAQALVSELGASTETIKQVAGFIAAVAEETNLLALNATIEAARAGDLGRGFAVVAEQVKGLARKTSESTSSIGADVAAMQARMQAIGDSIEHISRLTGEIDGAALHIADSATEQRDVTGEVTATIARSRSGVGTLLAR